MVLKLARRLRVVVVALLLVPPVGQVFDARPAAADHAALKGDMKVFEALVDQTMAQTFAPPFGLLEKTKGAYLPGFGVVFSLEVNLYPVRFPSPFNPHLPTKEEMDKARKERAARILVVKQSIPRLLADHSSGLRSLSSDESVAVITHLFRLQTDDGDPTQVVIEVRRSDLDQYENRKFSYEQLLRKMKVSEF